MVENRNPLFVLSISHKQAPVQIRSQFAFDREQTEDFLARMRGIEGVWGAVLVSTCNRTEVYYSGDASAGDAVQRLLADAKGADIHVLRRFFRSYQGERAVIHLFRVAAGLDSRVLGEDEILGQIRDAYNTACGAHAADYYIHALFQRALGCAKQIKTKTCLSKSSVSIATLSASEAAHFKEGVKRVLLLGATGQMGGLIAKNLSARGDIELVAAVRRHCRISLPEGVREIAYEERYHYIDQADVVISATASPHYTITYEACRDAVRTEKERLFMDIAVPRDMDPDLVLLEGASLKNIDFFEKTAIDHDGQKKEGKRQAEDLIRIQCQEAEKDLVFHGFLPLLEDFTRQIEGKSARQLFYLLKDCAGAGELRTLLAVSKRLMEEQEN